MRSFMLSTLALAALALPAAAQERICREPNIAEQRAKTEFNAPENLAKYNDRSRYSPTVAIQLAASASQEAFHNSFIERCKTGEVIVLKETVFRPFEEELAAAGISPPPAVTRAPQVQAARLNIMAADILERRNFLERFERYCDLTRPVHQVRNSIICFAQVPPRE